MAVPEKTWIDVADTAIKIGLGGIVAGIFAWIVAWHTARSAISKLMFQRRSDTLSDIAHTYETFFQAYLKYANRLYGLVGATQASEAEGNVDSLQGLIAVHCTEVTNLRLKMSEQLEGSFFAQSRLMLLGEDECRKKAESLHMAILDADQSYKFDGEQCDMSHFVEKNKRVGNARIEFYRAMEKAFAKR